MTMQMKKMEMAGRLALPVLDCASANHSIKPSPLLLRSHLRSQQSVSLHRHLLGSSRDAGSKLLLALAMAMPSIKQFLGGLPTSYPAVHLPKEATSLEKSMLVSLTPLHLTKAVCHKCAYID
jgi:hypothetical protein